MKNLKRIILIILIIANCAIIFKFSSEQSEKSTATSGAVVNIIIEANPRTRNLPEAEKNIEREKIAFPVRKTAHFTVYMCLGILLFLYANTYNISNKKQIAIGIFGAFLYACSDEIHQTFVNGRTGQFRDVCIDTIGATCGVMITYIILKKILRKK